MKKIANQKTLFFQRKSLCFFSSFLLDSNLDIKNDGSEHYKKNIESTNKKKYVTKTNFPFAVKVAVQDFVELEN